MNSQPPSLRSQELRAQLEVFGAKLEEAGVTLSFNEDTHYLAQEQALVARDLDKLFANSQSNVNEFVKGLKILCKKEKLFRKALVPTKLRKRSDANDSLVNNLQVQQESLIRILLKVNCLQNEVINILLEEITTVSSEETEDTSWLRLLLHPLQFLPYIKDAESLTVKLLDILDVATFPAQLEILDSIPEIVPDSQYAETANQLSKLLDDKEELSGAIIDCLNALNLDSEVRSQVHDRILAKILSGTTLKIFPILLQFLMTDCKSQNLVNTLFKIRNALDTIMLRDGNDKEKESCKILIFNRLQAFAISPKIITEAWLNMISSIKVHSDHKPIDYLILIMLHSVAKFKKRIIEAIFRKRIHDGLFKIALLEKMFEKYIPQQLLKDYLSSIVEIASSLLRSSTEPAVTEFASTMFRIVFNHEYTEVIYRREVLDSLLLLTGASEQKTVSSVLKIISSLLDTDKLQKHIVLLTQLLEKLDRFELKNVKEVFEILCTLTCGEKADDSMSGLRDTIHMVVRKQLSSSKRNIKHRGIISAVVMAKHTALISEEQDVKLPDAPLTIAMLPRGPAREAANLLELTSTCTTGCPELMGLYYDQLAFMLVVTKYLDKYFLAWLHETITQEFGNNYILQTVVESINDIKVSKKFLLNSESETSTVVNIAGLIGSNKSSILLLASHFRLLRLIHYRQQAGDLSTIIALLGCAVLMPDVEDYSDLDSDQVKQVADCLFHCTNWFREIINGFVTQKSKRIRARVVQRLQDIIDLEKQLRLCMENVPDHKLPVSYFDSLLDINKQSTPPQQEKGRSKKKFKSNPVVNEVNETVASTSAAPVKKKKPKAAVPELQINFREMDTDLVLLLKYPLKFDEDDGEEFLTQTATLNLDQLNFVLSDYVSKLAVLTQDKNIGLSHLNVVVPISLIIDSVKILPNLDSHFKMIVKKINALLERTDGRHDLPEMFTDTAIKTKRSFGLILEVFHLLFNWAGFQHSRNLELLKDLLKSMRIAQSQTLNSANRLILEFINRLGSHYDHCLELPQAVTLVKTMEALYSATVPSPDIERKIVNVAEKLLCKRWYNSKGNLDTGRNCNINIDILVKAYLKNANTKKLSDLVDTLAEEAASLKTKEDCLHMLTSIDKQNFHILYLGFCSALLNRVKSEVQALTNTQHLELWQTVTLTMQRLISIAKIQETRTNLSSFLKKSIGILNVFLSQGVPIMEIMLRSKTDEVVAIFKTLQVTTRFLHHLCCYSKLTKDASLTSLVPRFRLTLETLVYKVKATLVANNCPAAFWMGTLRNRNLQGEDILSQSTTVTEDVEDRTELPDDDSDIDAPSNNSATNVEESVESDVFD